MASAAPKVSVIVLTFNQEATIGRALQSVIDQQGVGSMEILVCDDASNDRTPDICRRFVGEHPEVARLVVNPVNKGLVRNYFDAVRMARGEYIADVAGDDAWLGSDRLCLMADFLDSHPEVPMVHTDWRYYDVASGRESVPAGSNLSGREPFNDGAKLIVDMINAVGRPVPTVVLSAAMYRRQLLVEAMKEYPYLFDNERNTCEDLPVIAAMAARGPVAFLPVASMLYSVGGPTISSMEDFGKTARFCLGTTRQRLDIARAFGVEGKLIAPYMAELTQYLMANTFYSGDADLRRRLLDFLKEYGLKLSAKGRLLKALSTWGPLWRLSNRLIRP